MEKLHTPVVAGVSGAAVLAALLSFGGDTKKPVATQDPPVSRQTSVDSTDTAEKGTAPNQDGPWRAVCEEYAPNDSYSATPTLTRRGYEVFRRPSDIPEDTVEVTTKADSQGRLNKITVHKQFIGDLLQCIPNPQLKGIHLIIATLPDPDKTEMRLEFDRYIEALEKAAAIRGFHYTGYWFPWSPRQTGPVPHKEEEVEAALLRAEQPGILLFHNNDGQRLLIFVVGETPTSGINRMQMVQALRYRDAMITASRNADKKKYTFDGTAGLPGTVPDLSGAKLDGPLMISGPHFSAGLASLAELLKESNFLRRESDKDQTKSTKCVSPDAASEKKDEFPEGSSCTVKIVSPNVSSDELIGKFNEYCNSSTSCSLQSLSITGTEKKEVASGYLESLGYKRSQIAELLEDESAFGDSELVKDEGTSGDDNEVDNDTEASGTRKEEPFGLVLTFPRELSAVRNLSDRQSEQLAESGAKLLSSSKNSVDIKLGGQEPTEQDRPSIFATDAEASEISDALEDDVRVLREKNIQCIVVSATNPLDRIFLLEYIRDRLPNVRTVAEDTDELEISHPHFIDLTGTIVISSLPTVPELAAVNDKKANSIAFASVAAEEQFLSTALLLDGAIKDVTANDIRERGWRISITGENGFELVPPPGKNSTAPIAHSFPTLLFGKDIEEAGLKSGDGIALWAEELDNAPRLFISFSIVIFLLTILHLVWLLNSERPKIWRKILERLGCDCKNSRRLKYAYVEPGGETDFNRTFNLLALNNQIFLLNWLVLMVNPVLSPFDGGRRWLCRIAIWAWIMVACMGLAVLSSVWRYLNNLRMNWNLLPTTEKVSVGFFSFLTTWYLISSSVFLCRWRGDATNEWRRIMTLDNGLSPVVPITAILLAWALWAALQLRRVKWIAYRKMDPASRELQLQNSSLGQHICDDIEAIQRQIDPATIGLGRVCFVLIFVAVVASWQWPSLRGIEPYNGWGGGLLDESIPWRLLHLPQLLYRILAPPSFEWWFGVWGFVMLLATVILTAYQISRTWKSLSRLLRRLESTRMKCAFEKIGKDDRVHIKLWDLGKAQLRFDEMTLIIESLRRMKRSTDADTAHKAVSVYQNADLAGRQPTQTDRDELNRALNVCMKEALEQLEEKETPEHNSNGGILRSLFWKDAEPDADHVEELDRYLALRLATLVRYVLLQMRNLMWFLIYGYFLAVVSVTFYPFQGGKSLSDMLAVTFAIVLVILGVLVTGVLRNPMLKGLEDDDNNMASLLQACLHLLSVGGLPALALLAWQFPWIGQVAFSWMRPLLSAFR